MKPLEDIIDYADKKLLLDSIKDRLRELGVRVDDSSDGLLPWEGLLFPMPLQQIRTIVDKALKERTASAVLMTMAGEHLRFNAEQRRRRSTLN